MRCASCGSRGPLEVRLSLYVERFRELGPLHQMEVSLAKASLAARGRLDPRDEGALRFALSLAHWLTA